jgi:CRP/FNR family cyclic AMP-dependent transcriptional regulator
MLFWRMVSSAVRCVSAALPRYPQKAFSRVGAFDLKSFLDSAGLGRTVARFQAKEIIFAQGDLTKAVIYTQEGSVKLAVVNETGKEAVLAILGPGDFFGEGCLAGQRVCMATATAITPTSVLVIGKDKMTRVLHD